MKGRRTSCVDVERSRSRRGRGAGSPCSNCWWSSRSWRPAGLADPRGLGRRGPEGRGACDPSAARSRSSRRPSTTGSTRCSIPSRRPTRRTASWRPSTRSSLSALGTAYLPLGSGTSNSERPPGPGDRAQFRLHPCGVCRTSSSSSGLATDGQHATAAARVSAQLRRPRPIRPGRTCFRAGAGPTGRHKTAGAGSFPWGITILVTRACRLITLNTGTAITRPSDRHDRDVRCIVLGGGLGLQESPVHGRGLPTSRPPASRLPRSTSTAGLDGVDNNGDGTGH